ncbi:class I tRNA ligase family protein [Nocardia terpenica]|uniref:class I tRNA ligase family protein n=1 Tax=Nocardia terpenica TaxID=455432 RepID=UPI002FE2863E
MIVSTIPRTLPELDAPDFVRSAAPEWATAADAPFQVRRVTLRPGEITTEHNHHDLEAWVILDGEGEISWDTTTRTVRAGDAVYLPPLAPHTLRNTSADRPLSFYSIWWEDMAALARTHADRRQRQAAGTPDRPVLILPSFPTPNGELHLGHIAGPLLTADACRRAVLATGARAHLLLGTVGHQTQVAAAAAAAGLSFHELAERNTDAITAGLAAAGVEWDVFVRPSEPSYPAMATTVFRRLLTEGALVTRSEPTNYCEPCGRFLLEAFVSGSCPHCGSDQTAGIECEACALPYNDRELVDPRCAGCGAAASQRMLTRYFLPLEPLRDRLTDYLRGTAMNARLRGYVDRVLGKPLPDLPVSTPTTNGIPIHVEQTGGADPALADQRMYSAFELAARYLVALDKLAREQGAADWSAYAAEQRPRTVLFFGFDNAFLRAFAFPAVLGTFTDALPLPDTLVCNEFYLLEGAKFSTSRRHAVWARAAFTAANADQLRLHLAATTPDVRRRNFTAAGYAAFVSEELIGRWQAWIDEVGVRTRKYFGGRAPEGGGWNVETERFYGQITDFAAAAVLGYLPERFNARSVVAAMRVFVTQALDFAETSTDVLAATPAAGVARTSVALELMAVRTLAMALTPLAPTVAARLAAALGEPDGIPCAIDPRWVRPGTDITFDTGLFGQP